MQILGTLICLVGLWVIIDSFFAAIYEKSEIDHIPLFADFWRKSFDFKGKTSRKVFWFTVLQVSCIYLLGILLFYIAGSIESLFKFTWIYTIISFIPNLSIQIRRLNDIGKEPVWVLLSFVPFVSLILIFWYAKPSQNFQINENKKRSDFININSVYELAEVEEKLAKLKSMLERGVISAQEYEELRKKCLGL